MAFELEPGEISRIAATVDRPKEYHPYPKWVVMPDGERKLVQDEAEHMALIPPKRGPGRPRKDADA